MAELAKSYAVHQTELADNDARAIEALHIRNAMASSLSGYASLYVDGGAVAQLLNATPATLVAFAAVGPSRDASASHATDAITVGTDGAYVVSLQCVATGPVGPIDVLAELYANGVRVPGFTASMAALGASAQHMAFSGLAALAAGDALTARVSSVTGGNLTATHAHLAITRVG